VNTILLATDGSPSARKATATAVELARATGADLRVVAVWHVPVHSFGYVPVNWTPELVEAERAHAHEVVEGAIQLADEAHVPVLGLVREGDPAGEICAAARAHSADVIVMGAHGWGALKRLVFGSVSTRVLHEAPCSVLVARGLETADDVELVGAGEAQA